MTLDISILTPKSINEGQSEDDFLWRMSIDTYHQMIEMGAFSRDDEIELIHGYLVKKMPKNRRHAKITQILLALIGQLIGVGDGWFLSVQDPITLGDSEPEPDLALIRGNFSDYTNHPGPEDIGIVIEVADSSLEYDTVVKKRLFAQHGIPQYWIVNLLENQIDVFREPFATDDRFGYRMQTVYLNEDRLPLILDDQLMGEIEVKTVFQ